jgi:hypothetical protein
MNICKACRDKRCHTELEKRKFHPLMGHGYSLETGWTHSEAQRLHEAALRLPPAQIPGTVSNFGGPQ